MERDDDIEKISKELEDMLKMTSEKKYPGDKKKISGEAGAGDRVSGRPGRNSVREKTASEGSRPGRPAPEPPVPGRPAPEPPVPGKPAPEPSVPGKPAPEPSVPGKPAPKPPVPGKSAPEPSTPGAENGEPVSGGQRASGSGKEDILAGIALSFDLGGLTGDDLLLDAVRDDEYEYDYDEDMLGDMAAGDRPDGNMTADDLTAGNMAADEDMDVDGLIADDMAAEDMSCEDMEDRNTFSDGPAGKGGDGSRGKGRQPHNRQKRNRESFSLIRPSDGLAAAFFVPVIIMVIIFAQRGIFPFGEESFLRTDMYHQYAPFFSEFQHKLTQGGSLLYSWDVGMGVNFMALYAYYLASPLNWLLALCPKPYIIEFMTYMIVFKIGLSGLAFAWYLRKHCRTTDFGVAFFAIFYAMSGYMAAYSWNIMWLDCIILFPLIMLGLERLVKEKKCFLYCITLGLSILSNYYISIMICIFMVLYFGALLLVEGKKTLKEYFVAVGNFALYSLLAGGLAAVVLLPEIYALNMTASGDFNFPKDVKQYFAIFDMIARHLPDVETEIGLDHWPNIYCGVAVLMFFLLYLASRRIKRREKIVYCGMLLFLFASFSINVLNFIWHGFHFPNSLPCRQSFIYIALMLLMCYQAYSHLRLRHGNMW